MHRELPKMVMYLTTEHADSVKSDPEFGNDQLIIRRWILIGCFFLVEDMNTLDKVSIDKCLLHTNCISQSKMIN